MKLTTTVYPFDTHFLPIIRHNLLPKELEIISLVSPKGWGYSGRDAGTIDYGAPLNYIISSNFDESLDRSKALFITESDKEIDKHKFIFPKIFDAFNKGKNIYCSCKLNTEELIIIREIAKQTNSNFTYYCNNFDEYKKEKQALNNKVEHKNLDTPVIMVFGLIEQVSKFDIQIGLTSFLRKLGYKVSLLSSRSYGTAINEHSVPSFLFDKTVNEFEKIILFNNYVKDLERKEQPDIFVIGVPGGLLPINNRVLNYYGITAHEMTLAISPDVSIVCTQCENFGKDYFSNLSRIFEGRLSMLNPLFYIDNTMIDFSSDSLEGFDLMKIDFNDIDLSELNTVDNNIFSRKELTGLFKKTLEELASDNDIKIS